MRIRGRPDSGSTHTRVQAARGIRARGDSSAAFPAVFLPPSQPPTVGLSRIDVPLPGIEGEPRLKMIAMSRSALPPRGPPRYSLDYQPHADLARVVLATDFPSTASWTARRSVHWQRLLLELLGCDCIEDRSITGGS